MSLGPLFSGSLDFLVRQVFPLLRMGLRAFLSFFRDLFQGRTCCLQGSLEAYSFPCEYDFRYELLSYAHLLVKYLDDFVGVLGQGFCEQEEFLSLHSL